MCVHGGLEKEITSATAVKQNGLGLCVPISEDSHSRIKKYLFAGKKRQIKRICICVCVSGVCLLK